MFKVGDDYYILTDYCDQHRIREKDELWKDEGDILNFLDCRYDADNFTRLIRIYKVRPENRGIIDKSLYFNRLVMSLRVSGGRTEWGEWYEMPNGKYYFWVEHDDREYGHTNYYRADSKEEMIKMLLGGD